MEINNINITPQSGSAGTDIPISISVTAINEGIDKVVEIDAVCGDKSDRLTIVHEGLREPFGLKDGGVFRLKNGGRFGVLKEVMSLPYTEELDYLESTGTQYIDTGVYVTTSLTNIEAKVIISKTGTQYICGAGNTNNTTGFSVAQASGTNELIVDIGNYATYRVKTGVVLYNTGERVIKIKDKNIYVNGALCGTSQGYINGTASTPLYLFANRDASTKYMLKMYYFKEYDGDTLIRDFIPVLDKDGIACMYDKVSREFFYNQGTGSFIAGHKNK